MLGSGSSVSGSEAYTVSVVRLRCSTDEFKRALVGAGMSPIRVDQVLASIPCTVKTGVSKAVAEQYAEVFRSAGAEVLIEDASAAAPAPPAAAPLAVPTVNLRGSPSSAAAPPAAIELPPLELEPAPPAPAPSAGPPAIELGDLPADDEPMQLVSREHGFAPDGGGATPQRPRFPLAAPTTAPAIVLPPSEPREIEADEPDGAEGAPALEIAAVDKAASAHARSAGHQDKQVSFKVVLPPPPEPWWKRRLPHMITGAILLVILSYVYGCTKVHGRAIDLRRELANGMRSQVRAPGNEFGVWTPAAIREAARKVCAEHGFKLKDVKIVADKICTRSVGFGMCQTVFNPPNISRLDAIEQTQIARGCPKPDWILGVTVTAKSRWGLYAYEVEEVGYITLTRWSPTDEITGDGRCEENGEFEEEDDPLHGEGEPQVPME
jgi:hypothetical protein